MNWVRVTCFMTRIKWRGQMTGCSYGPLVLFGIELHMELWFVLRFVRRGEMLFGMIPLACLWFATAVRYGRREWTKTFSDWFDCVYKVGRHSISLLAVWTFSVVVVACGLLCEQVSVVVRLVSEGLVGPTLAYHCGPERLALTRMGAE